MNIRDAKIITDINTTRARYGFGPVLTRDEQSAVEERRCDEIARLWMRSQNCTAIEGAKRWKRIKGKFQPSSRQDG